jgi:hypothetical protein
VGLDRLIHERLRLGILSALAVNESLSFNDLKKLMATTDGNLSVHARKLEEASTSRATNRSPDACHTHRISPDDSRPTRSECIAHMEALIKPSD